MRNTSADALARRFALDAHPENGMFAERHYAHSGEGRAASGAIYYYVAPSERTRFHRVDCDEYWVYNSGAELEIWSLTRKGCLEVKRLGTGEGAEPLALLRQGDIFAA